MSPSEINMANYVSSGNIYQKLSRPINNSPLIIFRILFGFLLALHFFRAITTASIYENFIKPPFTFNYIGFGFLQPLPGNGMYVYVSIMILLALLIMLGAFYRIAMTVFTLMWTALYLMQKADYNNHYYLMLLLCWIMIFMPAHHYCSVDVKRKSVISSNTCPQYCLWVFIAQVAIVYFFAALAKLSSDWFSGKYIAIQFSGFTHRFVSGKLYSQKWFQLVICYGGFLFDLLIVPLLLWRRSRMAAFFVACLFHLFNSYTFGIGIFPYLSIALNLFFLDPKMLQHFFFRKIPPLMGNKSALQKVRLTDKLLATCFGIYLFFQLLIPMRSWIFPGDVFWTEEGYRLSWKMMMRTKSGKIYFKVIDIASQRTWIEQPSKIFAPRQIMWLAISPDIIWQYAQRLKKLYAKKGFPNVKVYAISDVSLNRSTPMPMVDSTVDLGSVKWHAFRHSEWITEYK